MLLALLQLYDVGMTAGLCSDMLALAEVGDAWCAVGSQQLSAGMDVCGATERAQIATLRQRAAELGALTQHHLWSEELGIFANKMPAAANSSTSDGEFYPRISPTSFYPLMTGVPSTAQVRPPPTHAPAACCTASACPHELNMG